MVCCRRKEEQRERVAKTCLAIKVLTVTATGGRRRTGLISGLSHFPKLAGLIGLWGQCGLALAKPSYQIVAILGGAQTTCLWPSGFSNHLGAVCAFLPLFSLVHHSATWQVRQDETFHKAP